MLVTAGPKFGGSSGDGLAAQARFNDPDEFFFARLGSGCVQHDLPGVQEVNAVAYLKDLIVIVYNENDRNLALAP